MSRSKDLVDESSSDREGGGNPDYGISNAGTAATTSGSSQQNGERERKRKRSADGCHENLLDSEDATENLSLALLLDPWGKDNPPPPIDWDTVLARAISHPHEAAMEMVSPINRCFGELVEYPLNLAMNRAHRGNAPPLAVVRALLKAHPPAACRVNDHGRTPLHVACECKCDADVVRALLDACPEVTKMKCDGEVADEGPTPLHFAASSGDLEVLELLLDACPEAAEVDVEPDGLRPLHFAVAKDNYEAVNLLLQACPMSVGLKDWHGNLPIHFAHEGESSIEILKLLIKVGICQKVGHEGSGGVLEKGGDRDLTPLEAACGLAKTCFSDSDQNDFHQTWEVLLLMARAVALSTNTILGKKQIHDAPLTGRHALPPLLAIILAGCGKDIVRIALSLNPLAAIERDHCGRTPLALAATMAEPTFPAIKELLGDLCSGPVAARMADNCGRLPLHLAAETGWNYKNKLELLHQAEPRALTTRDASTRMYPFMLAAVGESANIESSFCLLRADPSLIIKCLRGQNGTQLK